MFARHPLHRRDWSIRPPVSSEARRRFTPEYLINYSRQLCSYNICLFFLEYYFAPSPGTQSSFCLRLVLPRVEVDSKDDAAIGDRGVRGEEQEAANWKSVRYVPCCLA